MDSQIPHDHHHHSSVGVLHQSGEGDQEDGQHHEKKSVLKKVKAKAKKIKDTITKHGHGHDHDHHDYEEDDDDEDDDVVEDPEIQGAPLYEGAAMRSGVAGQLGKPQDVGIGKSTATMQAQAQAQAQARPAPRDQTTCRHSPVDTRFTAGADKTPISIISCKEKVDDNSAVAPNTTCSLSPSSLLEDPHAPKDKTHLHAPPKNSQVKVVDPSGRGNKEAGESHIFDSFAKMKVNDDHEHEHEPNQPNRIGLSSTERNQGGDQSSYTQKISAVGSAMSGTVLAAKDYVASKLGYGETTTTTEHNTTNSKSSSSALEYGRKIASTMSEKLKPGEEDRALSEVISEAYNRRKDEVVKVGESAFRQQQQQPHKLGKVTESEELTRRLGKEDSEATEKSSAARAADATARSVVDMVKDTVGTWMGKGGNQQSQPSLGNSQGIEGRRRQKEQGGAEAEVRILQDSAN